MTLDQALQYPGDLLAVWSSDGLAETLQVCAVADGRLDRLAAARLPLEEREARTEALRTRGVRIGPTDGPSQFCWSVDGRFTVWSLTGVMVETDGDTLVCEDGRAVARTEVDRVVSFLDPGSLGRRGVKVVTAYGDEVVLVEEDDPAPALDPAYGIDNVMIDAAWASFLGRDLAGWLGAPHDDELP
jgi:hypothetical protein